MRLARSLLPMVASGALLLMSGSALAGTYGFTGKFTSNRGKIINIPMVGNTPCAPLTLMTGPGAGGTMTPTMHPILRGANTQPQMAVTSMFAGTGRDLQCVKHAAGKVLVTDNMVTGMRVTSSVIAFLGRWWGPDCRPPRDRIRESRCEVADR